MKLYRVHIFYVHVATKFPINLIEFTCGVDLTNLYSTAYAIYFFYFIFNI